jgi:putative SOS response-associated peptidase YedK
LHSLTPVSSAFGFPLRGTASRRSQRLGFTTAANELLRDVYERMPVILTRDAEAAWLDPKTQDTAALLALLKQYPAEEMEFYPVSRDVNSPAIDKASNIEPIKTGG